MIRSETEAYLRLRFHSELEFKDFEVSLRPGVHVVITGVVLRHNGRTDVPPLIEIAKVSFSANISGLLANKVTVSSVRLDGLQIHTPPRQTGRAAADSRHRSGSGEEISDRDWRDHCG